MPTSQLTAILKKAQKQGYLDKCMDGRKMKLPGILEALGNPKGLTLEEKIWAKSMYDAGFDHDF